MDRTQTARIIDRLTSVFRTDTSRMGDILNEWQQAFRNDSVERVDEAVSKYIAENKFMPTPGDIRELMPARQLPSRQTSSDIESLFARLRTEAKRSTGYVPCVTGIRFDDKGHRYTVPMTRSNAERYNSMLADGTLRPEYRINGNELIEEADTDWQPYGNREFTALPYEIRKYVGSLQSLKELAKDFKRRDNQSEADYREMVESIRADFIDRVTAIRREANGGWQ